MIRSCRSKASALLFLFCAFFVFAANAQKTDARAENMLAYQRSAGGWPKAVNSIVVDYSKPLTKAEWNAVKADSLHIDATFDNRATSREISYLVKAYKETSNPVYLASVEKGIRFILKAQYPNGGWPQYYPDKSIYRSQITYNDDAMVNTLNILQDIVEKKNDFDAVDTAFIPQAQNAVDNAVKCILNTQILVNGKRTAWCAQYDKDSLKPDKARAYELPSISGSESVAIVEFLMRLPNPSSEIKMSVNSAVDWFTEVQIRGYNFSTVTDVAQPSGKDRKLVADPSSVLWARFYDIDTNKPFFCGRDGVKKALVSEIEHERRNGYAWYGSWPQKLLDKSYPLWRKKNNG